MYFMTLRAPLPLTCERSQALGKQVRDLYCPRNDKQRRSNAVRSRCHACESGDRLEAFSTTGVYGGVDVSGKTVPLVPELLATAGASWRFTPRSRFNLNLRHVGRQRFDHDQANTFPRQMPEYTLMDAKLEHRPARRWEVALEVRNLFDKRYFSYGTATGATSFSALPAPGRAAYASLAWRLD